MTAAALDIIVVTFNARDEVLACLASLRAHPPARPCRLFVVDNASRDGTPAAVAAAHPEASVTPLPVNVGFAAANNVGIAAGRAPLVLLLNGDTLVGDGQVERLCAVLDARPEVGVAGPRLVDRSGRPELSYGPMMSPWGEAYQKLTGWALARGPAWWARRIEARLAHPADVAWVSGACLLTRRTVLEAVGGLDERYFIYTEDVDYCAAVRRAGHRIRYSPEAEVVHLRGRSRASAPTATAAHYRRSHLAFYRKHHPRWATLLRAYLGVRGKLPPDA